MGQVTLSSDASLDRHPVVGRLVRLAAAAAPRLLLPHLRGLALPGPVGHVGPRLAERERGRAENPRLYVLKMGGKIRRLTMWDCYIASRY